jgi:hypothetical protein
VPAPLGGGGVLNFKPMEKLVKRTIFKLNCTPSYRRPLEPIRIVMRFGTESKFFGNFYDEQEAMAALLHKLARLNEIGLMDVLTSAEVVFEGENE